MRKLFLIFAGRGRDGAAQGCGSCFGATRPWGFASTGTEGAHQHRERSRGWRGQTAPSAPAFLRGHLHATGLCGTEGHSPEALQGALDSLHLTGSSSALAATSHEGEAWLRLDSAALPLGTITAPLAPKPCKLIHRQG